MNGKVTYYHPNGYPSALGRMVKNKQEGIYMRYYSNGMTADSAFYQQEDPSVTD